MSSAFFYCGIILFPAIKMFIFSLIFTLNIDKVIMEVSRDMFLHNLCSIGEKVFVWFYWAAAVAVATAATDAVSDPGRERFYLFFFRTVTYWTFYYSKTLHNICMVLQMHMSHEIYVRTPMPNTWFWIV